MANVLDTPTTILASAARTATNTSSVFRLPPTSRGFAVQFAATAIASTPSVTCTVEHLASGAWATVLAGAALTSATTQNLIIHPDAADVANISESSTTLVEKFRVTMTHADADSMTYSVKLFPLK